MDLQEAIERIQIELTGGTWLAFPPPERPRPTRLFHYTSQAGLLGILTSKVLWATNVLYLNDSSELLYGRSQARQILRRSRGGYFSTVIGEFLSRGENFLDMSTLVPDRQFYVFCFCEKPDLLSQWRSYADRGGGCAIGFDTSALTRAVLKQKLSLYPVDYGPGMNSKLLTDDITALTRALDVCTQKWPGNEEVLISAACEHLKLALIFRVFWLKHPGFAEEQEWRILAEFASRDLSAVRFRQGNTTLVPYVELNLSPPDQGEKLPICEIIHGPSMHPTLAAQALDWLLKSNGFADVTLSGSVIPLRA